MRYKLINILMCPECKNFPLKLYAKSEIIQEKPHDIKISNKIEFVCDLFCGFENELIRNMEKNKKYKSICSKCLKIDITSGYLVCSKCKTKYHIINSIPRMIPKKFSKL